MSRWGYFFFLFLFLSSCPAFLFAEQLSQKKGGDFHIFWLMHGVREELLNGDIKDVKGIHSKFEKKVHFERDLISGKMIRWEGVILSSMLKKAMERLSLEKRAQIDLVVLRGQIGEATAEIPRAFLTKYPVLLAYAWDNAGGKKNFAETSFISIFPWSSSPKVEKEDLPVEHYFLSQVKEIDLTSYKDRYNPFFLKKRKDPIAIRGEKLFIQNCAFCHAPQSETQSLNFLKFDSKKSFLAIHKKSLKNLDEKSLRIRKSLNRLSDRNWKFIEYFFDAFLLESPFTDS